MRATAVLGIERNTHGRSVVQKLRSESPLQLIPQRNYTTGIAEVRQVNAAAAPLGGDRLELHIRVGPGAWLRLTGTGASLALPGPRGEHSTLTVHIEVADGGTLEYLPNQTIVSANADHRTNTLVELAPGARLRCHETLVLGRYGEEPGRLTGTTHVVRDGVPLLRQCVQIADHRLLSSTGYLAGAPVLATEVVMWDDDPTDATSADWWSLTPLARGGALATALAPNVSTAKRRLARALGHHPDARAWAWSGIPVAETRAAATA